MSLGITKQPTQVSTIPYLCRPQRLRELAPGTGSSLIPDLLSHEGAIFKAAKVHTTLREEPSAY